MFTEGINVMESESAFGELARSGDYTPIVSGYFYKIKELIPEIEEEKECLVVIWINDFPVKMVFIENGELSASDVLERSAEKAAFDIIKLAEIQFIPVYHVE